MRIKNIKMGLSKIVLSFMVAFTGLHAPLWAHAADAPATSFTLPYRAENRWVHVEDNASLNALTNYAKVHEVYSFKVILPESSNTNLYIERLLVLSRIMKARLKQESIVFRQELGQTPMNTIQISPLEEGTN